MTALQNWESRNSCNRCIKSLSLAILVTALVKNHLGWYWEFFLDIGHPRRCAA